MTRKDVLKKHGLRKLFGLRDLSPEQLDELLTDMYGEDPLPQGSVVAISRDTESIYPDIMEREVRV